VPTFKLFFNVFARDRLISNEFFGFTSSFCSQYGLATNTSSVINC